MRRRDFIVGAFAAAGGAATVTGAGVAQTSTGATRVRRLIDAHCHLFNARDLPIEGFTKKVLIPEYQQLGDLFSRYPDAFRVMIHALATIMQREAPAPTVALSGERASEVVFADRLDQGTDRLPTPAAQRARDLANIESVLRKIWSKDILRELRVTDARVADIGIIDLQKLLLQEVFPGIFSNNPREDEIDALIEGQNLSDVARLLYDEGFDKTIGRNIHWALLFTRYRLELGEELQRAHGNRSILLTPALVDFSKWVEDEDHAPIQQQVDAMTRVSLRRNGPHIHGFVGFDPLRQAIHEKDRGPAAAEPLAIVRNAVERGGFIGVKLYPPMGFCPIDNVKMGDDFPDHVKAKLGNEPGKLFDDILRRLYAWCEAHDVPIMAHAVNSNEAGRGYGKRANPMFWASVLNSYPRLRINMAHFGGFRLIGQPPNRDITWEWTIGRMITRAPQANIFADLSYFSELLAVDTAKRNALLANMKAFRVTFPNSADHLLFGSDWSMVGREAGFQPTRGTQSYVDRVAGFLHDAGYADSDIEKIMFANAVRYLGLGQGDLANGTRGRLAAFYAGHGRTADWLAVFDS
jgi:predicted TIM-barrel fold metal-dependent hydrolase